MLPGLFVPKFNLWKINEKTKGFAGIWCLVGWKPAAGCLDYFEVLVASHGAAKPPGLVLLFFAGALIFVSRCLSMIQNQPN